MTHRPTLTASVVLACCCGTASAQPVSPPADGPAPAAVRTAIEKALPLLTSAGANDRRERDCFSCHNQTVPLLALTAAGSVGIAVDAGEIKAQVEFVAKSLARNKDNYRKGKGQGGNVATAGFGLWALELGGHQADDVSTAVAEYLLIADKDRNHWLTTARRPPTEASHFTTVFAALRGLRTFGTAEQKERITARTAQVRRWLLQAPVQDNEDRVFRLMALKEADAQEAALKAAADDLLKTQRATGGWGQTDEREPDAYATATALVALHRAGGIAAADPRYRRGLAYLMAEQKADGSWHVKTRSRPIQKYFESGYPHGKDQFISVTAAGWAVAALAAAAPATAPRP